MRLVEWWCPTINSVSKGSVFVLDIGTDIIAYYIVYTYLPTDLPTWCDKDILAYLKFCLKSQPVLVFCLWNGLYAHFNNHFSKYTFIALQKHYSLIYRRIGAIKNHQTFSFLSYFLFIYLFTKYHQIAKYF